jgi:hypothetical protein
MITVRFGHLGEVVGFAVDEHDWRTDEREALNATLLDRIRAGEVIAWARRRAAATARSRARRGEHRFGPARGSGPAVDLNRFHAQVNEALVNERPGARGKPDEDYARAAAEYVRFVAEGERAPLRSLAGVLHVSESRARNIVHEARVRGLLTKTQPGRRGGRLTAKAQRLLGREGQP